MLRVCLVSPRRMKFPGRISADGGDIIVYSLHRGLFFFFLTWRIFFLPPSSFESFRLHDTTVSKLVSHLEFFGNCQLSGIPNFTPSFKFVPLVLVTLIRKNYGPIFLEEPLIHLTSMFILRRLDCFSMTEREKK